MKILASIMLACMVFISLINTKATAQCYELVWSDEFEGTTLNTDIWNIETGTGANNELQYYTNRPENLEIAGSVLTITARKENFGGMAYTSSRINSQNKFSFRYGKIEARIKLPYGQGIWPAFWMLGNSISTIGWPNCGEIDIMEMIGGGAGRDNKIYSTLHWGPLVNGGHPSYGTSYTLPTGIFADAYHTFSTVWSPTTVTSYCDDILFYTIDITPSSLSAFQEKFFIILNLAVGGDWPGSPDATTVFPQTMQIDYVKVYQGKQMLSIDGDNEVYASDSAVAYSLPWLSDWQYEWQLPASVQAIGTLDSNVIELNWGCIADTIKCKVTGGTCPSDSFYLPVKLKQPSIAGPMFYSDNQSGLIFSFPKLNVTDYIWTVPDDATITSGQGTDSITVTWGTTKDSVKIDISNSCGISHYSKILWPEGEYPYPDPGVKHTIPGTINATEYDYGGEGVAYHDNETQNQGTGVRPDEGVDTENGDGPNVGWIEAGEWLKYSISVAETKTYTVGIRTASANSSNLGPLKFVVNDEERASLQVTGTGSWFTYQTQNLVIELSASDTILKLDMGNGGFNVGNMVFSIFTSAENAHTNDLVIYPLPFNDELNLNLESEAVIIEIIDMSAKIVMTYHPLSTTRCQLNTSAIRKGMYVLKVIYDDGTETYKKIYK